MIIIQPPPTDLVFLTDQSRTYARKSNAVQHCRGRHVLFPENGNDYRASEADTVAKQAASDIA